MVGIVKVPPCAPVVAAMNGCVCVSWWKSTRQVKALAASAPSSGSEPVPEYVIVDPPL